MLFLPGMNKSVFKQVFSVSVKAKEKPPLLGRWSYQRPGYHNLIDALLMTFGSIRLTVPRRATNGQMAARSLTG